MPFNTSMSNEMLVGMYTNLTFSDIYSSRCVCVSVLGVGEDLELEASKELKILFYRFFVLQ